MKRCPVKLVSDFNMASVVDYFFFWKHTYRFPDDGPRLSQPTKLLRAFSFMQNLCYEFEKPKD